MNSTIPEGSTTGEADSVETTGSADGRAAGRWTFLTNHARVLLKIAQDPQMRLRDVAQAAGITERAAQTIVSDLEAAGYLKRTRVGRRNHYTIDPTRRFRHPAEGDRIIEGLLSLFTLDENDPAGGREGKPAGAYENRPTGK